MKNNKIHKLLIANRGEIAIRINKAAHALSIPTVNIASEADKSALFARQAQQLVIAGPAAAKDSYLNQQRILQIAKDTGCNAIHPGYGFLSENSDFARLVEEAGLIFVGPSSEAIRLLGSKTAARERAMAAGVPITPGCKDELSDQEIIEVAEQIGFPIIIKAVAGGGGRGMRIAHSKEELISFLPRARGEAEKNFSSSAVFIEKFIVNPRHVEVQVFGDCSGKVLHFGTRDCSTQRRHQKLVEEAPAPSLSPALREAIHSAAVKAAQSVNYTNAGTAEFLVKGEEFYFLEMNTRIQVEHPITEIVTGVDLVQLQLKVAQGENIPYTQSDIRTDGHAIEFRLYAENPEGGFMPSIGKITDIKRPTGDYIREDFGFEVGDEVTPHYDAMMSKLIVKGENRTQVIRRSIKALKEYKISGVKSNLEFFRWLLTLSPFCSEPLDIGYIEREFQDGKKALRALKASEIKDPLYKAPVLGACHIDTLYYTSKNFGTRYSIQVIHREDELFESRGRDEQGRLFPLQHCRVSNGFNTAVKCLIDEVLEKMPMPLIFLENNSNL